VTAAAQRLTHQPGKPAGTLFGGFLIFFHLVNALVNICEKQLYMVNAGQQVLVVNCVVSQVHVFPICMAEPSHPNIAINAGFSCIGF